MPLDERALRKPSYSEEDSAPVVMADGQTWHLRRPVIRIRPKFQGGRATSNTVAPYLEGGEELPALLDAIAADGDFVQAAINVGAYLLSFNYHLADEHLEELFGFSGRAGSEFDWARRIIRIANGSDDPKAPTNPGAATPSG